MPPLLTAPLDHEASSALPGSFRFLPYEKLAANEDGQGFVIEGVDTNGAPFGVGSGASLSEACESLFWSVMDALLAAAKKGEDFRKDLWSQEALEAHPPMETRSFLAFSPMTLFPVTLRLARVHADLTQAGLANLLNVSQQAIQKLETPGANPKLETVETLTRVLRAGLLEALPSA